MPWLQRRRQNCQKWYEKWRRRNQKDRHSVKRVQVTYPLLHKRLVNKWFPFLLYTGTHFFFSTIFSFLDESEEEGGVQPLSKVEEEAEVMRSWVEAGAFLAQQEEEAKGLLSEVGLSPCPPFSLPLSTFQLVLNFPLQSLHSILTFSFFLVFSGVRLTTKGQFTAGAGMKAGGESATVGNRVVWKDEGSHGRVRGERSLWGLEGSYLTLPPSPITASSKKASFCPQCHHLPTTPSGVHRTWSLWSCRSGYRTCLSSCSLSSRGSHSSPHATPPNSAWGH